MSDRIQITSIQPESTDETARAHSEKLQQLARSVLSGFYMLVRSVKMYDPDNAVFDRPLVALTDAINQIVAREGKLDFVGVKDSVYVNNMLVKVDLSALDNVRYLLAELRSKDVGGISIQKPIQAQELKNFVWIFSKEQTENASEEGLAGRKLVSMRLAKWSALKEKFDADVSAEEDAKIDRKKYALTVYGRTVVFLTKYIESVRAGKPIAAARSLRLVQDFVDLSYEQRVHFLGLTTLRSEGDYLVYHHVNTCLISIVFGQELGLTKAQLRDLGFIALFHDTGMAVLSEALATKKGALSDEERREVDRAPLRAIQTILMEKGFNRTTMLRLVTTLEHKTDYGTAVRDPRGNVQMVIPRSNLGIYARIIAICACFDALTSKRPFRDAYGPEVALMLMWTELRHRFDPDLLNVFMRVMAIQPVKILSRRQQDFTLG